MRGAQALILASFLGTSCAYTGGPTSPQIDALRSEAFEAKLPSGGECVPVRRVSCQRLSPFDFTCSFEEQNLDFVSWSRKIIQVRSEGFRWRAAGDLMPACTPRPLH